MFLFSELVASHKLTKNLPSLICLYLLNCRSRESLWKREVRTCLYPSLSKSYSKQDIAFSVIMSAYDAHFVGEKFGQVDHCSIHVTKDNRNSGLLSLQTTAFPSILEVLYCVLALFLFITKSF